MRISVSVISIYFIGLLGYSQSVKSHKTIENDSIYIDFINPYHAPMELNLSALDSTKHYVNCNSYGLLKFKDTLKNAVVIPIHKVPDTSAVSIKTYINFKASFGDPSSIIDYDYEYLLPYPKGKRYKIIQTFKGKFSHNLPHSKYAIDFGTQIGDTITAIRPGIVYFVKEDSKEYCKTRACINKANKIMVLHNDGSMASYVHLHYEGALVNIGDTIQARQPIGISGMTGFTTLPHLHLVIYKARNISIPFQFIDERTILKKGKFYTQNY